MTGLTLITRGPSERGRRAMLGGRTVADFRRSWADEDVPGEMVEHDIAAALDWPDELPPCPPWCRYRDFYDGHDYDGPLSDAPVPTFVRSISPVSVTRTSCSGRRTAAAW